MVDSITDSMDMNVIKLREVAKDREVWPAADHGVTKSQTRLSNCTTTAKRQKSLLSLGFPCHMRIQRYNYLKTRMRVLSGHRICQNLDLELPICLNAEK